jgi:hypothetical protein
VRLELAQRVKLLGRVEFLGQHRLRLGQVNARVLQVHAGQRRTELPRPDSSNGIRIEATGPTLSVNGVPVDAPAFLTARQKCERYMPHAQASQATSAQQTQRGLQFARCMRSHGVPNFPDPKVTTRTGGNQQVYLPGVNLQAPAAQTAAKACGGGPKGP